MKAEKVAGGVLVAGLGCIVGATLGGFIGYWAGAAGWTEGGEEPWASRLLNLCDFQAAARVPAIGGHDGPPTRAWKSTRADTRSQCTT